MTIVLALGMSSPFSTMVVATSTSCLCAMKSSIVFSSSSSPIWPWPTATFASGNEARHQVADRVDRLDPVVDDIYLATALQLVRDGAADHLGIELHDVGLDRQPILRRRFDDRHVADADERHVQRPRDWRRRHRQDVHALAELLDLFLVRDAETLLLVDDQKPEIAELHVFRQQAVRADDHVELAGVQVVENLLLLALAAEAAEHVDADRKAGKPLAQGLLVLKREDRGGCQKRHLFAVHHRFERCAHRHFRLAVPDVAAEQAIHRVPASPCRA